MGRSKYVFLFQIIFLACQSSNTSSNIFNPEKWPNWPYHQSLSGFSTDGQTLLVTRSDSNYQGNILHSNWEENSWQGLIPFFPSEEFSDVGPSLSSTGDQLFFTSSRDASASGFSDQWNIWVSTKNRSRWKAPKPLMAPINSPKFECCATQTKSGILYFSSNRTKVWEIYRAQKNELDVWSIEKLSSHINRCSSGQWPSYIDPMEQFLLFSSICKDGLGGDDIYISFNDKNTGWSNPINLGTPINTSGYEDSAILSPDENHLYFSSRGRERGHPFSKIYKVPFDLKQYQNRK